MKMESYPLKPVDSNEMGVKSEQVIKYKIYNSNGTVWVKYFDKVALQTYFARANLLRLVNLPE